MGGFRNWRAILYSKRRNKGGLVESKQFVAEGELYKNLTRYTVKIKNFA